MSSPTLRVAACWVLGALLTLAVGTMPAGAAEVAEQFKCPACHLGRLKEFKNPDIVTLVTNEPTPLEPSGRQNAASASGMCLSCHDGFVLDSRATFAAAHAAHPVGVVPSPRIRQPEAGADPAFPLNDDGKVYCGSCHTAHADEDAASEAPPFMRVGPSDGQLCSGCHADQGGMAGSPHGRVRGAGKPGAPADFEGSGLCGKCHVAHVAKGPLLWAKVPGEGNAQTDRLCRSCHRATGGVGLPARTDHPGEVWAWSQSLRSGMRARSTQEMPVFDKSGHRAVIGQISCATCHDAHGPATAGEGTSTSRTLLRVTDTTEFLCADCHAQRSLLLYRYFHSKATHSH